MPLTTHGHLRSKVIALLTAIAFVFITGCSHTLDGQDSTVSFCIDSTILQQLQISQNINQSRAANDASQTAKLSVSLKGGYEKSQLIELTSEETLVEFSKIPTEKKIWAEAEIYFEYEDLNLKETLYTGKSETITVRKGENLIDLKLTASPKQYNLVSKSDKAYTVINPIMINQEDDKPFESNIVEFVYKDNIERVYWQPLDKDVNVYDYQKARITYRGVNLKTDEENVLAFKTLRLNSFKNYYRDQKPATADVLTYEMQIPQGKKIDSLGIENKWDWESGANDWEKDFSFEIERIELIKDSSLAIDYDAQIYVDENPVLLPIANVDTYGNTVRFKSKEAKGQLHEDGNVNDGYAAAFWEFDAIENYDKVAVTVKIPDYKDMRQIDFITKGYRPFYENEEDEDFRSGDARCVFIQTKDDDPYAPVYTGEPVRIVMGLEDLFMENNQMSPTAIEFMNNLYQGNWGQDMEWDDDWSLEIEKIELIKVAEKENDLVIFDPSKADTYHAEIWDPTQGKAIPVQKEFSDDGKYLKVTPSGYNLNIFLEEPVDVSGYLYARAEVYCAEYSDDGSLINWDDTEVTFILRDRTKEGVVDFATRTVNDFGCPAYPNVRYATGFIGGSEVVGDITAYVHKEDELFDNRTIYLGKIIATTKKDFESFVHFPEIFEKEINVTQSGNTFTAESGFDSYVWKVDGVVQTGATGNVFTPNMSSLATGVHDITLIASRQENGQTVYYSYSGQVTK